MGLGQIIAETDETAWPEPLREIVNERRKYPPGLLSRAGYFLLDDSQSPLIDPATDWLAKRTGGEGARDWYFFGYGTDFKQALADYRALCGAVPMLPRYALGLWYSRYPTFNQAGLIETVETFEQAGLPLSVLVLDLEWHRFGWNGWDWDPEHISDPEGLLRFFDERGIHTTLNLHPETLPAGDSRAPAFLAATGIGAEESKPVQSERGEAIHKDCYFSDNQQHMRAFMEVLHDPVKRQGVDFWWMDGLVGLRDTPHLDSQAWTNHLYQAHARRTYPQERPMVMARSAGFGTHRYPFQFTGDTFCQWPVLKSSVEYLLRAGHIGQSYVTHDIGGHIGYSGKNLPEMLYLRWLQFGALSPICRLHSAGESERRPWKYSEAVQAGARASLSLRTRLVPYLYTLAWESAQTGLPMCRSNPLEAPAWEAGFEIWDGYFIGDRLYATPILDEGESASAILPPGAWICGLTGQRIESDGVTSVSLETGPTLAPPHFFKAGTVFVKQPDKQPVGQLPTVLEVHCYFASGGIADDTFDLYEDDGLTTAHAGGAYALTAFGLKADGNSLEIAISPRHYALPELPRQRDYRVYLHGAPADEYQCAGSAMERERSESGAWVHAVDIHGLDTGTKQVLPIVRVG
jgi:alpha-glucosidase (family GH31 glycosyl hydrolase)